MGAGFSLTRIMEKTLKVVDALIEGYEYCLRDGDETVTPIEDVEVNDLNDSQYMLCEKTPTVQSIGGDELRQLLEEHFEETEFGGESGLIADALNQIDKAHFDAFAKLVTEGLSEVRRWYTTDIRLVP